MRFAVIATAAAAAVAVPLAVSVSGPQMSSDEFLSAVRCTAYADRTSDGGELTAAKWRLNAEARRQPADTAALARAEASKVAETGRLPYEHAAVCAAAQLALAEDSPTNA